VCYNARKWGYFLLIISRKVIAADLDINVSDLTHQEDICFEISVNWLFERFGRKAEHVPESIQKDYERSFDDENGQETVLNTCGLDIVRETAYYSFTSFDGCKKAFEKLSQFYYCRYPFLVSLNNQRANNPHFIAVAKKNGLYELNDPNYKTVLSNSDPAKLIVKALTRYGIDVFDSLSLIFVKPK
jgi:hypothetical protein